MLFQEPGWAVRGMVLWAVLIVLSSTAVIPDVDAGEGEPPKVDEGVVGRLTVEEGTKVYRLSCPVTATPAPLITWKKDGEIIGAAWTRFRLQQNDKVLRIKNVRKEDSGVYVCEAVNGFGRRLVQLSLIVHRVGESVELGDVELVTFPAGATVPPFFIEPGKVSELSGSPVVGRLGTALSLPCHASGQPVPDIVWLKNGRPMRFRNAESEPRLYPDKWTLQLRKLKSYDSGRYTCRVSNVYGTINATYSLQVSDIPASAPRFTKDHPLNSTIHLGQTATFHCKVHSLEAPHIKWVKRVEDPKEVEDNSTLFKAKGMNLVVLPYETRTESLGDSLYESVLRIPDVRRKHSGSYICVVNNPRGDLVYQFAHLRVLEVSSIRPIGDGIPLHIIIGVSIAAVLLILVGYGLVLLHRLRRKGPSEGSQTRPPPPSYPPPSLPQYKNTGGTPARHTPASSGYYRELERGSRNGGDTRLHTNSSIVAPSSRDYQLYDPSARVPLNSAFLNAHNEAMRRHHQQPHHQSHHPPPAHEPPQPYELDFEDSDLDFYPHPHHHTPLQPHPSLYSCR